MSKLCPHHNNILLTALNEDFVMCIAADAGIQPQARRARLTRVREVKGPSRNASYYWSVVTVALGSTHRLTWLHRTRTTPWYDPAGEMLRWMRRVIWCYWIPNTRPSARPPTKQVCWGPALSDCSETHRDDSFTPAWGSSGREVGTWEIYGGVNVAETDWRFSSWPAGAVAVHGWEPAHLHAHYNLIIASNHIMVIVWLQNWYGLQ